MRLALSLVALSFLPRLLATQGITTAAIEGTVVGEDRAPIAGAIIRVTNTLNGRRWEVATQSTGGYLLEALRWAGPT